jgi:hypothetical protein
MLLFGTEDQIWAHSDPNRCRYFPIKQYQLNQYQFHLALVKLPSKINRFRCTAQ